MYVVSSCILKQRTEQVLIELDIFAIKDIMR